MMKTFDEIVDRLDQIDRLTNCKFAETHAKMKSIAAQYPSWWEHNELSLRKLVVPADLRFVYAILPAVEDQEEVIIEDLPSTPSRLSTSNSRENDQSRDVAAYNSIIQLIIHISRDWSAAGIGVRKKLYYEQIIPKLLDHLPIPTNNSSKPSVLIPGAGAGRLAWELASLGYRVEANECSATMVCFMNKLFNDIIPHQKELSIYPYLHLLFQDDWDLEMRSTVINFPYLQDAFHNNGRETRHGHPTEPSSIDSSFGALSVQFGDFIKIYNRSKDYDNQYDGIITNFFIDTGSNILEYLQTIERILKPSGIWINLGPLHYHNKQSIPYSYKHLLEIIQSSGFEILSYDTVENSYCGEEKISMKPEVYHIPINIFQLKKGSASVISVQIFNEETLCEENENLTSVDLKFTRPNYKVIN